MSTVNDTDLLIVNSGGQSYSVKYEDMSTVEDTDLLLINRGGQSFKVEAKDVKGEPVTAPVINTVTLSQTSGDRFDNGVFSNAISYTNQGSTSNTISMGVEVVGDLQQKGKTSPVTYVTDGFLSTPQVKQGQTSSIYNNINATTINNGQIWSTTASNCLWIDREELGDTILTLIWKSGGEFQIYGTDTDNTQAADTFLENVPVVKIAKNLEDCTPNNWPTNDPRPWRRYVKVYSGGANTYEISIPPTLSFQTDQDLLNGAFQPGDAVHKEGEGIADLTLDPANTEPTDTYYGWNAFNGTGNSKIGLFPTVEFVPPLNGKLEVSAAGASFWHVNKSESYITCPDDIWTTLSPSGDVVTLDGDNGAGTWPVSQFAYQFRLDGEELIIGPGNAVVSVNGAIKQMTLDGGDWAIGDVVENSVLHPIMVTPETSEIISYTNSTTTVNPEYVAAGSVGVSNDCIFKTETIPVPGSIPYGPTGCASRFYSTGDFIANFSGISGASIELYGYIDGEPGDLTFSGGGKSVTLSIPGQGGYSWTRYPLPGLTELTQITGNLPASNFWMVGVFINDEWTYQGSEVTSKYYTFADNKDLANFTPGMAITQDAPVTPVTSEITDVGTYNYSDGTVVGDPYNNNAILYSWPNAFRNQPSNATCAVGNVASWNGYSLEFPVPITGNVISLLLSNNAYPTDYGYNDIQGTGTVDDAWPGGGGIWMKTLPVTSLSKVSTSLSMGICGIEVDGMLLTNNGTLLTFQNNQQLNNFQAGDVVTGYTSSDVMISAQVSTTDDLDKFTTNWNAGFNTTNCWIGISAIGDYIELTMPTAGTLVLNGGAASYDCNITATGDFDGGEVSFIWNATSNQTFVFSNPGSIKLTATNDTADGVFINNTLSTFGGSNFLLDDTAVTVTLSTPSSNQMVVDGGTWSNGGTVTGPEIDGSGVCNSADPDGPTMNVSALTYAATSTLDGDTTLAFDGDLTTVCNPGIPSGYVWLTQATLTINTSLRIYSINGLGTTMYYRINGTEYSEYVAGGPLWFTVPFTGVANGVEIHTGASTCQVAAVEVDGVILIDETGPRFAVGSKVVGTPTPVSSITSYLTVDQNGLVQSLVANDPGLQLQASSQPSVIFPATMSTGQSPNNELPPGTTIQTTIKASNAAGEDTEESNILTPTGSDATFLDHCPTEEQLLRCHQKQLFNFHSYDEREELKQYQDTADRLAGLYEEINDLKDLYDQS